MPLASIRFAVPLQTKNPPQIESPTQETVVKAFRPPDAIKYSHAKPQEISLERRID